MLYKVLVPCRRLWLGLAGQVSELAKRKDERMSTQIRSWGVDLDASIPHSNDFCCENKECGAYSYLSDNSERYKQIVGFFNGNFQAIIIECPHCFERFWVHFKGRVDNLIFLCPNWPEKERKKIVQAMSL